MSPDTVAATADAAIGRMPEWNLRDLYPATDSPALAADLKRAAEQAKAFRQRYQGKLAGLDGNGLAAAVKSFEALQDVLGRLMSYAQLVHAGNMMDAEIGRFYQTTQERVTDTSSDLLFFTLELNKLEDADLAAKLKV